MTYKAQVDCFMKKVVLQLSDGNEICFVGERRILPICVISMLVATRLLRKGCEAYLAYLVNKPVRTPELADIHVVCEFSNVFPEDLPGLPPNREVEFGIGLIPVTQPIS